MTKRGINWLLLCALLTTVLGFCSKAFASSLELPLFDLRESNIESFRSSSSSEQKAYMANEKIQGAKLNFEGKKIVFYDGGHSYVFLNGQEYTEGDPTRANRHLLAFYRKIGDKEYYLLFYVGKNVHLATGRRYKLVGMSESTNNNIAVAFEVLNRTSRGYVFAEHDSDLKSDAKGWIKFVQVDPHTDLIHANFAADITQNKVSQNFDGAFVNRLVTSNLKAGKITAYFVGLDKRYYLDKHFTFNSSKEFMPTKARIIPKKKIRSVLSQFPGRYKIGKRTYLLNAEDISAKEDAEYIEVEMDLIEEDFRTNQSLSRLVLKLPKSRLSLKKQRIKDIKFDFEQSFTRTQAGLYARRIQAAKPDLGGKVYVLQHDPENRTLALAFNLNFKTSLKTYGPSLEQGPFVQKVNIKQGRVFFSY